MARTTAPKKETAKEPEKKQTPAPAPQPASAQTWFSRGNEGFERKHKIDEVARMRKEKGVPRFYLKTTPGTRPADEGRDNEARIIFLDGAGFWIHEHNLKIEGKWGNFFTCTKDFAPCEICNQLGEKSTFTCYFTVIDTRKFLKKDGTISKNRRVLFPAKGAAIDVLETIKKQQGDLRGLVVDVKRTSDRDPNCGRDFSVAMKDGKVMRINPTVRLEGEQGQPYDYMKVLAPPTPDELVAAGIHATAVVGSEEDIGSTAAATTVSDDDMSGLLGD